MLCGMNLLTDVFCIQWTLIRTDIVARLQVRDATEEMEWNYERYITRSE